MKFKIFEPSAFITTFTQKLIAKSDSKKRLHHEIEVFVGKSIFKPEITNSIDVLDCFPFFSATKRNCKITEKAKLSRNKKPSDKTIYKQKAKESFRQAYFCNDIDSIRKQKDFQTNKKQENPNFVQENSALQKRKLFQLPHTLSNQQHR